VAALLAASLALMTMLTGLGLGLLSAKVLTETGLFITSFAVREAGGLPRSGRACAAAAGGAVTVTFAVTGTPQPARRSRPREPRNLVAGNLRHPEDNS
jgi:hypothetical protein